MSSKSPLIVFSHLRWNFVYQRPQHVVSRLALRRPVLFIEEPMEDVESISPRWERSEVAPNVSVLVPRIPRTQAPLNFGHPAVKHLVHRLCILESINKPTVWTYTPSAVELIESLDYSQLIYDCMDELSAFLHAPPELVEQERKLMRLATMVFTGGPSLFRSKRDLHPEVYCFPSSVDIRHFRDGTLNLPEAAVQVNLPSPRLGFFGVIDERLDTALIEELARRKPEWQIVLVGPVVKIDPATLPVGHNIHYMGGRHYKDLPAYIKGWDVCLMPFAMNEATRFISPTKVLEYMAAGKPIVSTPITDVVEPYGNIVRIGGTADEFIAQCEAALANDEDDWSVRKTGAEAILSATSWNKTAEAMETLMERGTKEKYQSGIVSSRQPAVVIAGAGPAGLSAAYHLGDKALLIEQNERVGGGCRSVTQDGFTFDQSGNVMFSDEPYVHEMYKVLLGENVHWQDREAWIHTHGVHTRYPFQGSLHGLPAQVLQECLVGAIEARFGTMKSAAPTGGHSNGGHSNGGTATEKNGSVGKNATSDALAAVPPSQHAPVMSEPPRNLEEFIHRTWGAGIARHFAIPYNRKLWTVPLTELDTSWLAGKVPMPNLEEIIEGALKPASKPAGPNARFGYPLRGGLQALMDGFLPHLKGTVMLGTRIDAINPANRTMNLSDGSLVRYEHLINTMPLPVLLQLMGNKVPPEVARAAAALRKVSVRSVHIGVGRSALTEKHWIYYPGDTVFHRVFMQGNASPHCNASGGFGLTCEISYSAQKPLPCDGDDLTNLVIRDCIRVGLFKEDEAILTRLQVDLPYAYVVFDHQRKACVEVIRGWLATQKITLAGRFGEWEYYNSGECFLSGKKAAEEALRLAVAAPERRQSAEIGTAGDAGRLNQVN